jgi:hypothetical protein
MVVGVGFCKIKVDSNFLLVLKIKCTQFHQDRSKTGDLHTKYTNKQTFSFIYIYYIIIPLEAPFINIMFFALCPLTSPSEWFHIIIIFSTSDKIRFCQLLELLDLDLKLIFLIRFNLQTPVDWKFPNWTTSF